MGKELKANTKILFVVLKNKEKVLVPGKIISKNKTHSDWYNVESNDGKYTDLLKMGKTAVFGKTFELPVHENKLQESKLTSIIRKMIKEELDLDDKFESVAKIELNKYLSAIKSFNPKFKVVEGSDVITYYYELKLPNENEKTCLAVEYGLTDEFIMSGNIDDGKVFINYWPMDDDEQCKALYKIIQDIKKINPSMKLILNDGWSSVKLTSIKSLNDVKNLG